MVRFLNEAIGFWRNITNRSKRSHYAALDSFYSALRKSSAKSQNA